MGWWSIWESHSVMAEDRTACVGILSPQLCVDTTEALSLTHKGGAVCVQSSGAQLMCRKAWDYPEGWGGAREGHTGPPTARPKGSWHN